MKNEYYILVYISYNRSTICFKNYFVLSTYEMEK